MVAYLVLNYVEYLFSLKDILLHHYLEQIELIQQFCSFSTTILQNAK